MAVRRFRSIAEWNDAAVPPRRSDGFERFIRHNALIRKLSSFSWPRGVYRYRSIEEAQRAREFNPVSHDQRGASAR